LAGCMIEDAGQCKWHQQQSNVLN